MIKNLILGVYGVLSEQKYYPLKLMFQERGDDLNYIELKTQVQFNGNLFLFQNILVSVSLVEYKIVGKIRS